MGTCSSTGRDNRIERGIRIRQAVDVIQLPVGQIGVSMKNRVVIGIEQVACLDREVRTPRPNQTSVGRMPAAPIQNTSCGWQVSAVELKHADAAGEKLGTDVPAQVFVFGAQVQLFFIELTEDGGQFAHLVQDNSAQSRSDEPHSCEWRSIPVD